MSAKIDRYEPAPNGGYFVYLRVPGAYSDGSDRIDRVFVADADVRGKTPEQVAQAIHGAATNDPIGPILGQPVAAPTQTKPVIEDRMIALYETWRRWQLTRVEAAARALSGPIITTLTAKENAAWADYLAALLLWRAAS